MADMSLESITTGIIHRPLRISLYGVDGVGKTTFAANAPSPIFIATEDGTHHVNVGRFPQPEHWLDIVGENGAMARLGTGNHNYQTVVIDSMDWAEELCDEYIVEHYNKTTSPAIQTVTEIPFGKWKALKMKTFSVLFDQLGWLVRERNMHVICISHTDIRRFTDPERDAFERYEIKMYPPLAAKLREWCDYVLFANYDTVLREVGEGFNKRAVGSSHGKHLVFSRRRAAFDAKARFNIPERMEFDWNVFWAAHQHALTTNS